MPKRADQAAVVSPSRRPNHSQAWTPASLAIILGMLVERPRHPYAVFAGLRRRYPYLRVRNATVYTLLDTLKAVRWIEARDDAGHEALHATGSGAAARLQHDREWLTATARRIQARELAWP